MADKKQLMKDFVMWGTESDKSRQEAIDAACRVISALYAAPSGKNLSEEDLDKLAGGQWFSASSEKTGSVAGW